MAKFQRVSEQEIHAVISEVQHYGPTARRTMWIALFTLLANLGPRISEALLLTWKDMDFDRGELTIRTLKRKKPTYDVLPMNSRIKETLLSFKNGQHQTERVFPVSRRVAYNVFNACLHRAGIPPRRLHALRHSAATRLYAKTKDILFVQRILRHASISSTMIYTHCENIREPFLSVEPVG